MKLQCTEIPFLNAFSENCVSRFFKKSFNIAIWPKTPRRRIGASADIFGIYDVVYGEQICKIRRNS